MAPGDPENDDSPDKEAEEDLLLLPVPKNDDKIERSALDEIFFPPNAEKSEMELITRIDEANRSPFEVNPEFIPILAIDEENLEPNERKSDTAESDDELLAILTPEEEIPDIADINIIPEPDIFDGDEEKFESIWRRRFDLAIRIPEERN
jgi:hypothetical protein